MATGLIRPCLCVDAANQQSLHQTTNGAEWSTAVAQFGHHKSTLQPNGRPAVSTAAGPFWRAPWCCSWFPHLCAHGLHARRGEQSIVAKQPEPARRPVRNWQTPLPPPPNTEGRVRIRFDGASNEPGKAHCRRVLPLRGAGIFGSVGTVWQKPAHRTSAWSPVPTHLRRLDCTLAA